MRWMKRYDVTKKTVDFFIYNYELSTVNELNKIAKTFTNWYSEIINAYSKNSYGVILTNASQKVIITIFKSSSILDMDILISKALESVFYICLLIEKDN